MSLLVAMWFVAGAPSWAQEAENPSQWFQNRGFELMIGPGYQVNADVSTDDGELEVESGANFTVALSYAQASKPGLRGEFSYSRQRAGVEFEPDFGGSSTADFDADFHYFLLGALYGFPASPRVEPFAGVYLGAMYASPVGGNYDSETLLAISGVAGVKTYLSRHVGLRFQSRLLAPVSIESGSLFCSSAAGVCAVSVDAGTVFWQGDFTAGVVFAF